MSLSLSKSCIVIQTTVPPGRRFDAHHDTVCLRQYDLFALLATGRRNTGKPLRKTAKAIYSKVLWQFGIWEAIWTEAHKYCMRLNFVYIDRKVIGRVYETEK